MQEKKLLFVVGLGRSGTSLLHAMLSANDKIALTPETGFYLSYVSDPRKRAKLEKSGLETLASKLREDHRFSRLKLDADDYIEKYRSSFGNDLDLGKFYLTLLRFYADVRESPIAGDKDPKMLGFIDRIVAEYPGAKVIHMIRDPRDVLASRTQADWSKRYPYLMQALTCREQFRDGLKKARCLDSHQYIEILYEDLIASPGTQLNRVCDFIGTPYDDRMINFQGAASELVSDDEIQWKGTTLGPLLKKNSGNWKTRLSKSQILIAETALGDVFKMYPYKRSCHTLTFPQKALVALVQGLFPIYRKIYSALN